MTAIPIHQKDPPQFGKRIFHQAIASNLEAKRDLLENAMATLARECDWDEETLTLVRLCLDEALVNAVRHGNREQVHKKVTLTCHRDAARWCAQVTDEGEGFTEAQIPDPEDEETLEWEHGRGLLLMNELMDEFCYYRGGRTLFMVKRLNGAQAGQDRGA